MCAYLSNSEPYPTSGACDKSKSTSSCHSKMNLIKAHQHLWVGLVTVAYNACIY